MKKYIVGLVGFFVVLGMLSVALGLTRTSLTSQEAVYKRGNLQITVTHSDLTDTNNNGTQTIALFNVYTNVGVELIYSRLTTPFQETGDSTNASTVAYVGDGGLTNRFLTDTELNVNGTEVPLKYGSGTRHPYTASDTVDVIFKCSTNGALADFNAGEIQFYFHVDDER